jgi:RES domain-containing protein
MSDYGAELTKRLAALPRERYVGRAFRHQSPGFDPRSGEGARMHGGRFNTAMSFAALYLTSSLETVAAEFGASGQRYGLSTEAMLPRSIFEYSLNIEEAIDLTSPDVQAELGISEHDLIGPSYKLTQQLGESAFHLGVQAVITYSACAVEGTVMPIFLENLRGHDIAPKEIATWHFPDDVPQWTPRTDRLGY